VPATLRAVRTSPYFAKHVARLESKEAPNRKAQEDRKARQAALKKNLAAKTSAASDNKYALPFEEPSLKEELHRLTRMIEALATRIGKDGE